MTPCTANRRLNIYEDTYSAEGQLVGNVDWCHFSYKGYEVVYRPTEKSNWFVPVLGVWV